MDQDDMLDKLSELEGECFSLKEIIESLKTQLAEAKAEIKKLMHINEISQYQKMANELRDYKAKLEKLEKVRAAAQDVYDKKFMLEAPSARDCLGDALTACRRNNE